jgi:hypothetical protein
MFMICSEIVVSLTPKIVYTVLGDVGGRRMMDVDFAALVRLIRQTRGQTQEEFARGTPLRAGDQDVDRGDRPVCHSET